MIIQKLKMIQDLFNNRVIGMIAITLSLMPWVGFGLLNTDSQPWPLLGFIIFLVSLKDPIQTPKNFWIICTFLVFGFLVSVLLTNNPISFLTMRATYNYLGVVIFFIGFYNYILRYRFPLYLFAAINLIWLLFAFLELYWPDFVGIFSPMRTTVDRGVTSLAPEPTFFAIHLFFSSWVMLVGSSYKPSTKLQLLIILNLLSIFFLAKSAMVILFLGLSVMIGFIPWYNRLNWSISLTGKAIIVVLGMLIMILAIGQMPDNSRFIVLFQELQGGTSILELFRLDASMNARLEHIVYSIHGAFNNFLIPGGFDTFTENKTILAESYNNYFWYSADSNKIMSWIGDWMYQLGIFGFIFVAYIFYISFNGTNSRRLELLLISILLLSAIPLAFPLISMLFAIFHYSSFIDLTAIPDSNTDLPRSGKRSGFY